MSKNYFLGLLTLLLFGFLIPSLKAQSFQQIKAIDPSEIDAFIDSIPSPSKAELQFTYNRSQLMDEKIYSDQELGTQMKEARKAWEADKDNLYRFNQFRNLAKSSASLENEEYEALSKQFFESLQEKFQAGRQKAEAAYYLASIYQNQGELDKALEYAQKATELAPDSSKTWISLANVYSARQELDLAQNVLRKALDRQAEDINAHVMYISVELMKALQGLSQGNADALKIDYSLLNKAEAESSLSALTSLRYSAQLSEVYYKFVFSNLATEEDAEKGPRDFFNTKGFKDERLADIEAYFKALLPKLKNDKSLAYDALGLIHLLSDREELALKYYISCLDANPRKATAYTNIVFVHIIREEWELARQYIQKKIDWQASPDDYATLARIYSKLEKAEAERESIEKGLQKFPQHPTLLLCQALLSHEKGDMEAAQQQIEASIQGSTREMEAIIMYGAMMLRSGNIQGGLDPLYYAKSQGSPMGTALFDTYFATE